MNDIPHMEDGDIKVITRETLGLIAPEALATATVQLDPEDLDIIWFMDQKPVLLSDPNADEDERQEWSETNEPELGEWLAEEWDEHAVPYGASKVLILCGTRDDEYGRFWSHTDKCWNHYMF